MSRDRIVNYLTACAAFSLILSACGSSVDPVVESAIATSVAMTLQARQTEQAPTATPLPPTSTPDTIVFNPSLAPTFAPTVGPTNGPSSCVGASLVSENPPDGTIFKPGETFTKTWTLQNTGTCSWDTNYKITFYDGNILGGAYVYNLPLPTAPGKSQDISLMLKAPAENGTYRGDWVLQAPDGTRFGVGQYNKPFYVDIVVSDSTVPNYSVTSVTYEMVRDPSAGCATTVRYTFNASVTSNGPIKIRYGFKQSDGNLAWKDDLKFTQAETKVVSDYWNFHLGSTPGDKWVQFVVIQPYYQEFDKFPFSYLCGNTP